jgi:hypothetical protein
MQANHPVYQNSYDFQDIGSGQWKVNFITHQTQTNSPYFPMILELKIQFADSTDTTFRVMNNSDHELFSWTIKKQPLTFQFDPNDQIVLKQGTTLLDTLILASPMDSYGSVPIQSTGAWSIQGPIPFWLTVNKTSGTGNDTAIFHTLVSNLTTTERSVSFTLNIATMLPASLTVIQQPITGGIENKQPGILKIFPNPTSGIIQIQSDLVFDNVTVYNSTGMIILNIKETGQVMNVDLSGAGEGIYFLTLTGQNWVVNRKIILLNEPHH